MLMHVLPDHSLQVRDRFVNPWVCVAARYVRCIPAHIEQTRAAPTRAHPFSPSPIGRFAASSYLDASRPQVFPRLVLRQLLRVCNLLEVACHAPIHSARRRRQHRGRATCS